MQKEPEWYTTGWHEVYVKKYSETWILYDSLCKKLEEALKSARDRLGIWAIIQSPAKTVSSFAEKILRKYPRYKDPLQEMTDLAGVCVITLTQADGDLVAHFVENERGFEVDRRNSVDIRTRLRPNEFGYRAVHYIVSARDPVVLGVAIPAALRQLKAEIQIQNLLQYAWAKVGHDRIYKTRVEVPVGLKRAVNGVAAMLEQADNQFCRVVEALDTYVSEFETYMDGPLAYFRTTMRCGCGIAKAARVWRFSKGTRVRLRARWRWPTGGCFRGRATTHCGCGTARAVSVWKWFRRVRLLHDTRNGFVPDRTRRISENFASASSQTPQASKALRLARSACFTIPSLAFSPPGTQNQKRLPHACLTALSS